MPRPPKPIAVSTRAMTKKENDIRVEVESKIKAENLPEKPPSFLNKEQKAIYKWFYDTLVPSGYMSRLDIETITQACIIIDRLRCIDKEINAVPSLMRDREYRTTRDVLYKQFMKIAEHLCMTPAARAKMGVLVANTAKADPLEDLIGGGSDV